MLLFDDGDFCVLLVLFCFISIDGVWRICVDDSNSVFAETMISFGVNCERSHELTVWSNSTSFAAQFDLVHVSK